MFIVTWLFDKLGYMPKISVDTTWSFPTPTKTTSVAKKATTVAKKPTKRKVK
jgi:hypothetical protein